MANNSSGMPDFKQLIQKAERVGASLRATRDEYQALVQLTLLTKCAAQETRALFRSDEQVRAATRSS